jgi:hypothetical protein
MHNFSKCEQLTELQREHLKEIKVASRSVNCSITLQKMEKHCQYIITFYYCHVKRQLHTIKHISPKHICLSKKVLLFSFNKKTSSSVFVLFIYTSFVIMSLHFSDPISLYTGHTQSERWVPPIGIKCSL